MRTTTSRALHFVFSATLVACAADPDDDPAEGAGATAAAGDEAASTSGDPPVADDGADGQGDTSASDDGASDDAASDDAASDDAPDPTTTADPEDELPPTQRAALDAWLADGRYTAWAAESGPHQSTGPHGGDVRTFVNASLFASLDAGASEHDVGAAVVKELFDGDLVEGWAVMVKVESGNGGDGWYWYEVVGSNVYADGTGVGLCTGCHGGGTDFVLTPFPLQ